MHITWSILFLFFVVSAYPTAANPMRTLPAVIRPTEVPETTTSVVTTAEPEGTPEVTRPTAEPETTTSVVTTAVPEGTTPEETSPTEEPEIQPTTESATDATELDPVIIVSPTTPVPTVVVPEPTVPTPGLVYQCPQDPFIHWLLPHEDDCNQFYYCVWGHKVLQECPSGLHFNRILQVCDWPISARCSTK